MNTAAPAAGGSGLGRVAGGLSAIFFLRMLGLFMVLPVLSLYVGQLRGASPKLVGLALGIHGLTQGLLQIPFGMLADRVGRKPVIVGGLLLFAAGSLVAAGADSIWGIILGRALQGSGAIAAAMMALAADLTPEERRLRVMAAMGMSIGLAFMAAVVLGPILDAWVGLSGIFWLTAGLALAALVVLLTLVPTPVHPRRHHDAEPVPDQFLRVLGDGQLLRLDLGVFALHLGSTAIFVALPLLLAEDLGLESARHWQVYLPVMVLSAALMVPFIILAERRHRMKPVYVGAVLALVLSQWALAGLSAHPVAVLLLLLCYFAAFNLLEASLPSLVAKFAAADSKGTAMGFFSSSQYLGIFAGGVLGGMALARGGIPAVFALAGTAAAVWLLVALGMREPRPLSSYLLPAEVGGPGEAAELAARLRTVPGVVEAVVIPAEGTAYLKVDRELLDESALRAAASGAAAAPG